MAGLDERPKKAGPDETEVVPKGDRGGPAARTPEEEGLGTGSEADGGDRTAGRESGSQKPGARDQADLPRR